MKRTIAIAVAIAGLVVFVPTASANDSSDTTTAPSSDTSTTTEVPTTSTPTTEVPQTTTPTTSTPTTSTPTTSTPTTTTVPATTTVPTTGTEAPCVTDCIPVAEACTGPECIPTAAGGFTPTVGAGSALPFTGIEDMIAPILLALTVVLGGVVAWRWARLRESVAEAAQRVRPVATARETRSGYAVAARALGIEQRARQVFTPRVA